MTREEAKEVFLNRGYVKVNGGEIFDGNLWRQSYVVISEWLKEQEPCEDCISRAWLKGAIHNFFYGLKHTPSEEDIQAYIDSAPPVIPKRKIGRWEDGHCSECGCDIPAYIIDWKWQKDMDAKYCPMCGAKMAESEEQE